MIVGSDKPSLDELVHFGVKGMKWGQRKADIPIHPAFTKRMQMNDRNRHGARAVARINQRMNEGQTRDQALRREDIRNARQRLALIGAVVAVQILSNHGSTPVGDLKGFVANRANQNRAAAKVAESTIKIGAQAAKTVFVKPHRGVHNITTMK